MQSAVRIRERMQTIEDVPNDTPFGELHGERYLFINTRRSNNSPLPLSKCIVSLCGGCFFVPLYIQCTDSSSSRKRAQHTHRTRQDSLASITFLNTIRIIFLLAIAISNLCARSSLPLISNSNKSENGNSRVAASASLCACRRRRRT